MNPQKWDCRPTIFRILSSLCVALLFVSPCCDRITYEAKKKSMTNLIVHKNANLLPSNFCSRDKSQNMELLVAAHLTTATLFKVYLKIISRWEIDITFQKYFSILNFIFFCDDKHNIIFLLIEVSRINFCQVLCCPSKYILKLNLV